MPIKLFLLGGGGARLFWEKGGGGGSANFIFYGRGEFLTKGKRTSAGHTETLRQILSTVCTALRCRAQQVMQDLTSP